MPIFSRTTRELPKPLPDAEGAPALRPLPQNPDDMSEWAAPPGAGPDGIREEPISAAELNRRAADLSPAQIEGVYALATLSARENAAYARAHTINELEREAARTEAALAYARRPR